MDCLPDYAELHVTSNFTFLRGASHPQELVTQAHQLGYHAIAVTDECSLSGVVRAHVAAKECSIKLIIGSELRLDDGLRCVLLATDRISYGRLSRLITHARRNAAKGAYKLNRVEFESMCPQGCVVLWLVDENSQTEDGAWLSDLFPHRAWIAVTRLLLGNEKGYLEHTEKLSTVCHLPRVACGGVHMHHRSRRVLQDTLTAIRLNKPLSELGFDLFPNGERYLKPRQRLSKLYSPELLEQSTYIASLCNFSLGELRYEYPKELVPNGYTPTSWLQHLTKQGANKRWPQGVKQKVNRQIEHELKLITELQYESYFLTVYDIVRFAREQGILCQGRGSAANSAVCYCLGITEVNPSMTELLFERFISKERDEPPDIDVDFEHERREEVIQYIYRRYRRERTALAATVITYQFRSAIRDVGKALGFSQEQVDHLSKSIQWWDGLQQLTAQFEEHGFEGQNPKIKILIELVSMIMGFPRHLSQHVGGFVIAEGNLSELVPIENAAMPDRTVIQWEKDDLESLGLLKVDVLGLGMLSAIRKCFDLIEGYKGKRWTMDSLPKEDPKVYSMMQKADTVGVFQIESRAQMSMLPRLRPANYYDLVIQIAIVRPGPIQGDMVHPYLRRRNHEEPVDYPSTAVKQILQRTLGVPIFQEQVMQIAMVAAGFSPGESDQLRRSMAAWKRRGGLEPYEKKLVDGMQARGYPTEFAQRIFHQIKGFGDYGFPESHSASFALLAYVSSWLKCYEPAAFVCALLNSQPMGFYRPAQLVNDARRHNVEIRPVDVQTSHWDCTLEPSRTKQPAMRLGLRMAKGLSQNGGDNIVCKRNDSRFRNVQDLAQRARLNKKDLEALAAADALTRIAGHRHKAYWEVSGVEPATKVLSTPQFNEGEVMLYKPQEEENIIADYASIGLTLGRHPVALYRERLNNIGVHPAHELEHLSNGCIANVAGLVVNRQRPMTASGVIFVTLEDETGHANIVVWPKVVEAQRRNLINARLLVVSGTVQIESDVIHVIARKLDDYSKWLGTLHARSRDFH
ncbi:MAG: error-prone DNA polymerase [Gammaproteobacteria bacterium]|nr:error-prone DNA polymerase [Gammaproteobacteria bacterium]